MFRTRCVEIAPADGPPSGGPQERPSNEQQLQTGWGNGCRQRRTPYRERCGAWRRVAACTEVEPGRTAQLWRRARSKCTFRCAGGRAWYATDELLAFACHRRGCEAKIVQFEWALPARCAFRGGSGGFRVSARPSCRDTLPLNHGDTCKTMPWLNPLVSNARDRGVQLVRITTVRLFGFAAAPPSSPYGTANHPASGSLPAFTSVVSVPLPNALPFTQL